MLAGLSNRFHSDAPMSLASHTCCWYLSLPDPTATARRWLYLRQHTHYHETGQAHIRSEVFRHRTYGSPSRPATRENDPLRARTLRQVGLAT